MGPFSAIGTAAAGTLKFSGRASRSEYWWTYLLLVIVSFVTAFVDTMMVISLVEARGEEGLMSLRPFDFVTAWVWIMILPTFLSLSARRLHDAGFSGLWLLLYIIPLGAVVLLILHALPSQAHTSVLGAPAGRPIATSMRKPAPLDPHKRVMQGYGLLFDKDKQKTPQELAARKAEVSEYYRSRVLKSAPTA
jgi:uncharacterized membrane protein YhaH (DUF805 family)